MFIRPMPYQCILFDLDHTLWDYETNSAEALTELHHAYQLRELGISHADHLLTTFYKINQSLWDKYDQGIIQQDVIRYQRFHQIFQELGIDNYDLSLRFSQDYLGLAPTKGNLVPHAIETLTYLREKYYLIIITNGFDEIQFRKMESSGITGYFKNVVTSEKAGCKKPARGIFDFALSQNGFRSEQSIMIGDNLLTDIAGAKNAMIDTVFFNPQKINHNVSVTHEIDQLIELTQIL